MLPDTEARRSLIPLVKSFVAHHRGAEPGNLRPVFIVKQQICVCFFLSNALWHSTVPAGLGHIWMMPQSKRPWHWGRALGELLLGSWTSLGRGRGRRGRGGGEEKQQQLCCHQQAALGFVHMSRRSPRGKSKPKARRSRSSCPANPPRGRAAAALWSPPHQERFAFVLQPKPEVCGYRCALPLLPPGSTSH